MRYGKSIPVALVVVLAVAGCVVALTLSNLEPLVTRVIETSGTRVTGSPLVVGDLVLDILDGTGGVSSVRVPNPRGFSHGDILTLGRVSAGIDAATVLKNPVIIPEIVIRSPRVLYEMNTEGVSNLEVLQTHISKTTAAAKNVEASGENKKSTLPKVIVTSLIIEEGAGEIRPNPGQDGKISVALPRMELKNIGLKTQGATPDEVCAKIISALLRNMNLEMDSLGIDRLVKRDFAWQLGEAAEDAGTLLGDTADTVGKKIKSGAESLGNAAGEAADKIRAVFGK